MKTQNDFYVEHLGKENTEIKQVGWRNEDKAELRYQRANGLLDEPNANTYSLTTIDVGCGLGTFRKYVTTEYVGIDIMKGFVNIAKKKFADYKSTEIIHGRVDKYKPTKPHSYVSLGAYTYVGSDNVDQFVHDMWQDMEYMISTNPNKIVINGFHNVVTRWNPTLYYHNLNDWIAFGQKHSKEYYMTIEIFENYEFFIVFERNFSLDLK